VDAFVILKFFSHLMLPPASMALGFVVGAVLALVGRRRLGVAVALLSAFEALIFSAPPVTRALVAPLERYARDEASHAAPCCYSAIVVLGGGWNDRRTLHGARLYKRGIAQRIIVTGADLASEQDTTMPEAERMKHLLVLLGVPVDAITAEDAARNTAENIANVKKIVGDEPVALVTSAYHMKRSLKLARRGALRAYAFPTDFAASAGQQSVWDNWLPTVEALHLSAVSLREYVSIIFDFRAVKPTPVVRDSLSWHAPSAG
jgi:uncharacterized SAM-binding protein YcdF (DUF218 family)